MRNIIKLALLSNSLLLDKYKGATLALSFRKLRTTYKGASFKTTSDFNFNTNPLILAGASISAWYDQGNSNNNAYQVTNSSQPIIANTNNFPSVQFDGINDCLSFPNLAQSGASLFVVVKINGALSGYKSIFSSDGTSSTSGIMLLANENSNKWGTYNSTEMPANTQLLNGSTYLLEMHRNSSSGGNFYLNGKSDGNFANTQSQNLGLIAGGSSQYTPMQLLELIFYPYNAESLRNKIAQNINNYYKIY